MIEESQNITKLKNRNILDELREKIKPMIAIVEKPDEEIKQQDNIEEILSDIFGE